MYYYHYPFGYPITNFPVQNVANTRSYSRKPDFNIPFLPILGTQSVEQLKRNIYKAIVDEATAVEFYARLLKQAPDQLHRDFIKHAHDDERKHLEAFKKLYMYYTGQDAKYQIKPAAFTNYKSGILKALKDELEAAEFYRDQQLSSTDQVVKDTFYFAMVDEQEHATMFSTLYSTLNHQ